MFYDITEIQKKNSAKMITKKQYENFCREFVFDKLKGVSFGEAFCKKFNFNNLYLKSLNDEVAKFHIEKLGYIK